MADAPITPAAPDTMTLSPQAALSRLIGEFLDAVQFDARQFFAEDGTFQLPREIPRPLMLLVKGVKLRRLAIPAEWIDLLGVPAVEVEELRWESQARLLLDAIELIKDLADRQQRQAEALSDEEIERGALKYVAARFPQVAEAHPDVFGREP